jgi:hypothetical protein
MDSKNLGKIIIWDYSMDSSNNKYVYIFPRAGFNDMLTQLQVVIDYSKKNNRKVLFDFKNSLYNVNLVDYYDILDNTVIYDNNIIREICILNHDSVYPESLNNKLILNNTKKVLFDFWHTHTDLVTNFPSDKCTKNIIVSIRTGGGNGYNIFKELIPKQTLKQYCQNNYKKIPKPYISIHIRNTDIKTDYKNLYYQNKNLINQYQAIYIATDDKTSLNFFKQQGFKIYNFTTFPDQSYHNLHGSSAINGDIKFKDMISDLFCVSMSDKFFSNSPGGFTHLLKTCYNNKNLIREKFKL